MVVRTWNEECKRNAKTVIDVYIYSSSLFSCRSSSNEGFLCKNGWKVPCPITPTCFSEWHFLHIFVSKPFLKCLQWMPRSHDSSYQHQLLDFSCFSHLWSTSITSNIKHFDESRVWEFNKPTGSRYSRYEREASQSLFFSWAVSRGNINGILLVLMSSNESTPKM